MKKEKLSFNAGDWVIMKESFIQKTIEVNGSHNKEILDMYNYPQTIQAIYRQETKFEREVIEFSPIKKWILRENEFRLATEKEIIEHKIKSIFG